VAALNGPQDHLPLAGGITRAAGLRLEAIETACPASRASNAKGAFYLFPNVAQTGLGSLGFLRPTARTAEGRRRAGTAFGAGDYIPLSYAPAWKRS